MPRPFRPRCPGARRCAPVSHGLVAIVAVGLVTATALPAACPGRGPEVSADLVLFGGAVVTEDPARPEAEAVAVRGDSILAVGRSDEVLRLARPAARPIDLHGALGGPRLSGAHGHLRSPREGRAN